MRKFWVILLLTVYTSSVFNLQELVKLPMLIEHYQYHVSTNPNMGMTEFLYVHYIDCPQNVSDYADDMKLPFKSDDCKAVQDQYIQSPVVSIQASTIDFNESLFLQTPIYRSKFIARYQDSIWQPPKLA